MIESIRRNSSLSFKADLINARKSYEDTVNLNNKIAQRENETVAKTPPQAPATEGQNLNIIA